MGEVILNPCLQGGGGSQTGPRAANVIHALDTLDHLELSAREPASVGEWAGEQVDITVSPAALAACGGLAGAEVAMFDVGEEVWRASPGERFRLIAVDVADQPLTIAVSLDLTDSQSVQELEDLLKLAQRILGSVEF